MRFVWAVVAFVLATLLIGAGIAQRTVFLGPAELQTELEMPSAEPFVLVESEVLRANPGQQKFTLRNEGPIFVAVARTADARAWLSTSDFVDVSLTEEEGEITSALIRPTPVPTPAQPAAEDPAAEEAAAEEEVVVAPALVGSDLWLEEYQGENLLFVNNLQIPDGMSVLIASDGVADAPSSMVLSWPLDRSTPGAGPLIVAGSVVLLIGLILYFLAIRHHRRRRGPRRKGVGPLPETVPIDVAEIRAQERVGALEAPADKNAADASPDHGCDDGAEASGPESKNPVKDDKSRNGPERADGVAPFIRTRSPGLRHSGRRWALPALGLSLALLTGCTAESWPQPSVPTQTPSPTPTVELPENQQAPAVTVPQAERILASIAQTVAEADAALDSDLAATRLSGPALEARRADYALRAAIPERATPTVIPSADIRILLPQAIDIWPRTVLVLSENTADESIPPVILTMVQDDPWSPYRVSYLSEMRASSELPDLAPAWLGTALVPPDSPFLALTPTAVAAAFSDLVDAWEESQYFDLFDQASRDLAASIRESRQTVVQTLIDNGAAETSTATFDLEPSSFVPMALSSLDSGAIVAAAMVDTETVTPTTEDAVIRFGNNAEATALTGVSESASGVVTTYGLQLFFSVPSRGSAEPIRLLAIDQDLLGVSLP